MERLFFVLLLHLQNQLVSVELSIVGFQLQDTRRWDGSGEKCSVSWLIILPKMNACPPVRNTCAFSLCHLKNWTKWMSLGKIAEDQTGRIMVVTLCVSNKKDNLS